MLEPLGRRDYWIFDMDGTLTVAAHDFDAIRSTLGLPPDLPILEEIASRPPEEARALTEELDRIELEIARRSCAQDGAGELLEGLRERGHQVGILTRNSEANAVATLDACGLLGYFDESSIVGRESSAPKPSPDGVELLLRRWQAAPTRALVVGDYRYDLEAGRAAGTAAVYFDAHASRLWESLADHRVERLVELLAAL